MKLLLDTHTFIWFIEGNEKLSTEIKELIESTNNQRFLSIASLWEMTIKTSLGKLYLYSI
jgi:PIN domain nuclease of toxin-antitoxin system